MVFVFGSVYVMDYVYRFVDVEPALHPRDEADLIMVDKFFDVLLDSIMVDKPFDVLLQLVCQYFIKDFCIYVHMDIGLKFSFFVESLPAFGIRMTLVS